MAENRRAWRWMKLLQDEQDQVVIQQLKDMMPAEVRAAIAAVYRRPG